VTPVTGATYFYDAEQYHQDYYRTNPTRYNRYRSGCGRDRRLRELWGAAATH
jgi:peptide-methionine (S)-S-oxide reductase